MRSEGGARREHNLRNMAKKTGRPTKFTIDLGTKICKRIAEGESLRHICRDEDMPNRSTVHLWLLDVEMKAFSDQYEIAVNVRAEGMFEEILDIADDGSNDIETRTDINGDEYEVPNHEFIQRSRLRVDTRKWFLSKVMPKKFGDKVDVTSGGKAIRGNTIVLADFGNETGSK